MQNLLVVQDHFFGEKRSGDNVFLFFFKSNPVAHQHPNHSMSEGKGEGVRVNEGVWAAIGAWAYHNEGDTHMMVKS